MRKAFIIIIGLVVIMTIAALVLMFLNNRKANDANTNVSNVNSVVPIDSNTNSTQTAPTDNADQQAVVSSARSFAERYGSWAPDSIDANIYELKPLLTDAFANQVGSVHESAAASPSILSVSSQALSSTIKAWEADSRATIEVVLNRTEQRQNEPTVEYYRTLTLTLIFLNDKWLIDNAEWGSSRVQPGGNGG